MRLVSLVPSLTETLCDLGLKSSVVGCTTYCIEPKDLKLTAVTVGGTKDSSLQKIQSLKPTHVFVNLEENTKEIVDSLRSMNEKFEVIETFPQSPAEVVTMLQMLGDRLGVTQAARKYSWDIESRLSEILSLNLSPLSYAYFIWRRPWMLAGENTYIAQLLKCVGFQNVVSGRYPAISDSVSNRPTALQNMVNQLPRFCLFSSEPYPFKDRDLSDYLEEFGSESLCVKVDGKYLSWHGTRTLNGLEYALRLSQEMRSR